MTEPRDYEKLKIKKIEFLARADGISASQKTFAKIERKTESENKVAIDVRPWISALGVSDRDQMFQNKLYRDRDYWTTSDQPDLTEFLASFRVACAARGSLADPTIVEFHCKSECTGFIAQTKDGIGRYRYLIQHQYIDFWRKCERRYFNFESRETRTQLVIVAY